MQLLVAGFGVLKGYVLSDESVMPVQQQAIENLTRAGTVLTNNNVLKPVKMINLALNHLKSELETGSPGVQ